MKSLIAVAALISVVPDVACSQDVINNDPICAECGRRASEHRQFQGVQQQRLPVVPRVAAPSPSQTYAVPLQIPRPTYRLRYSGIVYVDALGRPVRRGPVRIHRPRRTFLRLPRLVW